MGVPASPAAAPALLLCLALALVAALGRQVVVDFEQCDRDCRWVFGFYEEEIRGTRVDEEGNER